MALIYRYICSSFTFLFLILLLVTCPPLNVQCPPLRYGGERGFPSLSMAVSSIGFSAHGGVFCHSLYLSAKMGVLRTSGHSMHAGVFDLYHFLEYETISPVNI